MGEIVALTPAGTHDARQPDFATQAKQTRVSTARSLTELAGDYEFFSPGPLLMYAVENPLKYNIVQDFVNSHDDPPLLGAISLANSFLVFNNTACKDSRIKSYYSRSVFVCERSGWNGLFNHLAGAVIHDRAAGMVAISAWQRIKLRDQLAESRLKVEDVGKMVNVTLFCPSSNKFNVRYGGNAENSAFYPIDGPISPKVVEMANALMSGSTLIFDGMSNESR